jgi:hypothetical protein
MFPQLCRTLIGMVIGVASVSTVLLLTSSAEGQLVRVYRGGGGVHVITPFVRVDVGPDGATSVRAPFTAVDSPGHLYVGPHRGLLAPSPYTAPTLYGGQAAVQARPFPTQQQLTAMDDAALLATLRDVSTWLNLRLDRLKTGAGWQRYLGVWEEALEGPAIEPNDGVPPVIQIDLLQKVLTRFDRTADNPEYAKIATLSSFIATRTVLREVIERFGEPQIIDPLDSDSPRTEVSDKPQNELLPSPTPEPRSGTSSGERSILKRAGRGSPQEAWQETDSFNR